MASTVTLLSFSPAVLHCHRSRPFALSELQQSFHGFWSIGTRNHKVAPYLNQLSSRWNTISRTVPQAQKQLFENVHKDPFQANDDVLSQDHIAKEINKKIKTIKAILGSMEDGEISVSAYDTAWVAMVEDINEKGVPQFPTSIQWIVENQFDDGSWGDCDKFSAHDRILNTLACVIALKSWNIYPRLCEKGMVFIRENMSKLENEDEEHMPIGFEIAFPSLLELAEKQNLQIPRDTPFLQDIHEKKNLKLTKIPWEMMHAVPTTLLHSIEGMFGLDWEKLIKLQSPDGSFLFSPSSTAYALMRTKDEKCLAYLQRAVETFNGGVPNVYPVDLFEHIWAVDRLERLGIARFFQSEIEECVSHVHRYWTEDGICWARNSSVQDIDDTAMGFRLMRLHGYDVSPDCFRNFYKNGEFFCFAGQSNQAITGIFNLYRASQVLFPEEQILREAKIFSSNFLKEKRANNQLLDKWIITKDLPGEVGYALDVPWYASLPRIEARFYIDHYGGGNDVWIGKTLYRMPYVNNNNYLELAMLDFNKCQSLHKLEWTTMQSWFRECNLGELDLGSRELLLAYFLSACSIYEPERAPERLSWAKSSVIIEAVTYFMEMESTTTEVKKAFLNDFNYMSTMGANDDVRIREAESKTTGKELVENLHRTLDAISLEIRMAHHLDVRQHLSSMWTSWLVSWCHEKDEGKSQERELGVAELLVNIINLCAGRIVFEEDSSHPQYKRLIHLTNAICAKLRPLFTSTGNGKESREITRPEEVDPFMEELVEIVLLKKPDTIDSETMQTFLTVAKSFYYAAHCSQATINTHISKVLFESVA